MDHKDRKKLQRSKLRLLMLLLAALTLVFTVLPTLARAEASRAGGGEDPSLAGLTYKEETTSVSIVSCDPAATRINIPDYINGSRALCRNANIKYNEKNDGQKFLEML